MRKSRRSRPKQENECQYRSNLIFYLVYHCKPVALPLKNTHQKLTIYMYINYMEHVELTKLKFGPTTLREVWSQTGKTTTIRHTAVRKSSIYRHHGRQIEENQLKIFEHHSTMVSRGLKGALKWYSLCRETPLRMCVFPVAVSAVPRPRY